MSAVTLNPTKNVVPVNLTDLPFEILCQIAPPPHLELSDQNALSLTCRKLYFAVKSNFTAIQSLKYLEENMPPLDETEDLLIAVQRQEDARKAEEKAEDENTVDKKKKEAENAEIGRAHV